MSGYANFQDLMAMAQGGMEEPPKPSGTYEKVSLDHVIKFGGKDLKTIDVRFLVRQDEFFHKGLAKIYRHHYFDKPRNSGATYDCLLNYNRVDCPICELQRKDFNDAMELTNKDSKLVDPFIAKSHSKNPETFSWVYVKDGSDNMKDYIGKVMLMKLPDDVSTLIKNHSDAEWCQKAKEPYLNFIDPSAGATVRVTYDGTTNDMTKAYSRSKVLTNSEPMIAKVDGTVDSEAVMKVYASIPEYTTKTAKFFSFRIAGTENTPLALLQAYNAYSATRPHFQYRSVHKLMEQGTSDAQQIPQNGGEGNFNNFAQPQSPVQQQAPVQQAPAETTQPVSSAPSYDDFDDDIPF